jgi:hypothetical protein
MFDYKLRVCSENGEFTTSKMQVLLKTYGNMMINDQISCLPSSKFNLIKSLIFLAGSVLVGRPVSMGILIANCLDTAKTC